jgi:CubicO group peptidase (beta-lactamase class C family)
MGMEEMDTLPYQNNLKGDVPLPTIEGLHPRIHAFLHAGYQVPLSRKPDSVVIYSNYAFELLGEVVRRVSGLPLAVFLEQRAFKRLVMSDTHFIVPAEKNQPSNPSTYNGSLRLRRGGIFSGT